MPSLLEFWQMSGRAAASIEQAPVIAKILEALRQRNLSTSDIASKLGISAAYLQTCLSGKAPLAPSRLVVACRELGVDLAVLCKVLDRLVGDTTLLRASRAVQRYDCSYCNAAIRQGQTYVRLESSGLSRRRGVPVEYFCRFCAIQAGWLRESENPPPVYKSEGRAAIDQMVLPFAQHLKPTLIQLIDVSEPLYRRIAADPDQLMRLTPAEFEGFVVERLSAMGLCPQLVGGGTFRRDGGVDIVFTPPRTFPFPFLGAVQVKHHREANTKVGPSPVRELMGVIAAHRFFSAGMIVTNTSFTADARDFADRSVALLRLRDFNDLMRWVRDNFVDDAEWRELPRQIQLCDGVLVDVPR